MRAEMKGMPKDYPREYVEVHLTTFEKLQLKVAAGKAGLALGPYIRQTLFPESKNKLSKMKALVKTSKSAAVSKPKAKASNVKMSATLKKYYKTMAKSS